MNPQNPYHNNPSFYFHPPIPSYQNPNYSQNPNFSHPQPILPNFSQNPNSSTSSTTTNDHSTTLSILKDFINQANTTLKSLPDQILLTQNLDKLCCCPFNPNHKMLPEFLFHHFLICSSSPGIINLDILDSLHYPKSIMKSESVQPIGESNDEICISVDDYLLDFRSNLFYKDCPAVVCSSDLDRNETTFRIPRSLYMLCSDFSDEEDAKVERRECMKMIMPSELWAVRSEMEVWYEYPVSYSYIVNRVCQCLGFAKECDILNWIIMNSPRYGIVIDVHMRDHIYMLLKLCMKAIEREACRTYKLMLTGNEGGRELDLKSLRFDCPVLLEVMKWLSSQFTVLYGEVNGKLFSKELLKWCLLNVASSSLLYPLNDKGGTVCGKEGLSVGCVNDDKGSSELVGSIGCGNVKVEVPDEKCNAEALVYESSVSVSHVTAAVAALHERSLLEEKIKGLRLAGSLPKSQLLREYLDVSTRAPEERRKRPNYRPILEHDGLLWQRYHNKDSNKSKTREELLAEERDYKRRRMSYRGKKVKRSKTEVLRDIIEVHMNEIKQAGGIGCFVKGSAEAEVFAPGSMSVNYMPAVDMLKSNRESSEPSNRPEYGYEKQSYPNHGVSARPEFATPKDLRGKSSDLTHLQSDQGYESQGQHEQERDIRKNKQDKEYSCRSPESYRSRRSHERHRHHRERDDQEESGISARKELGTPKDYISRSSDSKHSHTQQGYESHDHGRSIRKNKQDKEYRSRSPESYRSRGSHERHRHQRERDDREGSRTSKYDKTSSASSHRSRNHDSRSLLSVSNPVTDSGEGKNDQISDIIGYNKKRTSERYRSESAREKVTEDRYDPSGSNNGYEDASDNLPSCSQYVRPDKSY
ncbi:hypothetical protein MKW94_017944 [Papaver nudicaule]|uniref:CHHC U11-48K-type domain-containing protein n=1 Tax=Papaver nudicaule TaxID=74823 RepID=A0AA41V7J3_PAPNU|nr:hypothetical protein [Papaver nudicaule]